MDCTRSSSGRKISELRPLAADPNYRQVMVDGRCVATLRESDVDGLSLTPGKTWTASLAEQVALQERLEGIRREALKALARRAMPASQLRKRLMEKGHEESEVQTALDHLTADGWLDDSRLADTLVHEMTRRGPVTPGTAKARLKARGVDDEAAQSAAEKSLKGKSAVEAALAFAEVEMKKLSRLTPTTAVRRLAGALARRGFEADVIETVLDRLSLLSDDDASHYEGA